jgi:hypothetical protein
MQHYRVPTRLLGWSESLLVGLYFAVTEHPEKHGSLWRLDPVALNVQANIKFDHSMEHLRDARALVAPPPGPRQGVLGAAVPGAALDPFA